MVKSRLEELNKELDRILNVIINDYAPDKVILFGSMASGNINEYSDIDLVIVKDSEKSFYERLEEVARIVQPDVGADIIVYTPEEFKSIQNRMFIKEEVIGKGKVIYDACQ